MPIYCSAQAPRGKLMPSKAQNPIISNLQKIYICTTKDFKNYSTILSKKKSFSFTVAPWDTRTRFC